MESNVKVNSLINTFTERYNKLNIIAKVLYVNYDYTDGVNDLLKKIDNILPFDKSDYNKNYYSALYLNNRDTLKFVLLDSLGILDILMSSLKLKRVFSSKLP